jgi:hypothetical protein
MPFLEPRVGDIYQPMEEAFTFHEVFEHRDQLCFRTFKQSAYYWPIDTYKAEDMKYIGNGNDDPFLRKRCECLVEVNFWLMYGQVVSIPRTSEYYSAIKEWQAKAPAAKEVLIRRAYEKQNQWLSLQNPRDWGG